MNKQKQLAKQLKEQREKDKKENKIKEMKKDGRWGRSYARRRKCG